MTSECTHHHQQQKQFEDSMNTQALEHNGTMVEVYSKMKPDTFHVTVANRLDRLLRGDWECQRLHQVLGGQAQVQGPDLRPTQTPPTLPTPPPPPLPPLPPPPLRWTGAQQLHMEEPPPAPSPGGRSGGGKGRAGGGGKKACGKA